jgi:hypothetical protein
LPDDFDKSRDAMMGGPGSGGWNRSLHTTVEEHRALDVTHLYRSGLLGAGGQARRSWAGDGPDLLIVGGRHELGLRYRARAGQGGGQHVEDTIALCWRPCAFGGERPFLVCPGCTRSVLRLHLAGNHFRCRPCQGLTYASQREREHHRALRRAQRLRQRLGPMAGAGASRHDPRACTNAPTMN